MKEKNEIKNLILFADIHVDPACCQLLESILLDLVEKGYKKLYMECSPPRQGESAIQSQIVETESSIHYLEVFPDGYVPDDDLLTPQQLEVLRSYRSYLVQPRRVREWVNEKLTFNEGRLDWLKARLAMLKKIDELSIEVLCIDVENVQQHTTYAGGMKVRTDHMYQQIISDADRSGAIILAGFGHMVDIWESDSLRWVYSRGLIRQLSQCSDLKIQVCLFPYSKETEQKDKAFTQLKECSIDVTNFFIHCDLANCSASKNVEELFKTFSFDKVKITNILSENYYVFIHGEMLASQRQTYIKACKAYITDLGGKYDGELVKIYGDEYLSFSINTVILTEPRLKRLSMGYCYAEAVLSQIDIKNIRLFFPEITIQLIDGKTLFVGPYKQEGFKAICTEILAEKLKCLPHDISTFFLRNLAKSLLDRDTKILSKAVQSVEDECNRRYQQKKNQRRKKRSKRGGRTEKQSTIIDKKVSLNNSYETALVTAACWRNGFQYIDQLFQEAAQYGVVINCNLFIDGQTALHRAVMNNNNDIVSLLISQNANINKVNSKGEMAIEYAKNPEIKKLLTLQPLKSLCFQSFWRERIENLPDTYKQDPVFSEVQAQYTAYRS